MQLQFDSVLHSPTLIVANKTCKRQLVVLAIYHTLRYPTNEVDVLKFFGEIR
jgi:hypothetical protein